MDKRDKMIVANLDPKKEKHLEDAEKADGEIFEKGAYTNGMQDL